MKDLPNKIIRWLKQHAIIIAFTLLAGILSVIPHLLAWHALGNSYQGIPFLYSSNEDLYLARIHEITDGHYLVSSPHAFEYKNTLPLIPPIGEYFYVFLSLLLHTSLPNTLVIAKFLFPAILFLLVYNLIRLVSGKIQGEGNMWGAIAGGAFVVFGIDLVGYQYIIARLTHSADPAATVSIWTRPVNPITGALLLFAYLPLLWQSVQKSSWLYPLSAGFVLALSVGYIFTWGIGFAILGMLLLFALFHKEYAVLKRLFSIALTAIFIDALYWIQILPSLSMGGATAERNGMIFTHAPLLNKVLLAAILLFSLILAYAYRFNRANIVREHKAYAPIWFSLALLLGSFFALNQQILTGRTIWPYHFVQYSIPLAAVALFITLFVLLRPEFPRIWKGLVSTTIILSIAFAVWNASTYTAAMNDFRKLQEFAPIFNWININAPKDCVVLVSEDWTEQLNGFIPAFTRCDVYLSGYMNNANVIPPERIEYNFFVKLRLAGVTDGTIKEYLADNEAGEKTYFFKDWKELLSPEKSPRIAAMNPRLIERYNEFMKKDFETALKEYRIDYIVSPGELSSETWKALPDLREIYKIGSTTIYDLNLQQP
jgi:hypothetical protein